MPTHRLFFAAVLLASFTAVGEPRISVQTRRLPPLPGPPSTLAVFEGRPALIENGNLWQLGANDADWIRVDRAPPSHLKAVLPSALGTYLLVASGADAVTGVTVWSGESPPPLPSPLQSARAAVGGETLYVGGLDGQGIPRLYSIQPRTSMPQWRALAGWPDSSLTLQALVAQTSALWAVCTPKEGQASSVLFRWSAKDGWTHQGAVPGNVIPGAVRATGQAHLLFMVQTQGDAKFMTYQTITHSWTTLSSPETKGVRSAVAYGNGFLWEMDTLGISEISTRAQLLGSWDWVVIIVYLISMLGMGLYFYLREKRTSTSDFFVGGRSIPFWAAGVSLYAANTSSISYIAIPAKSFATNWQYLANSLITVAGLVFVALWIVPLLRRLNLMSVFHYLETRFHPVIRTLASALFILVQIGSRLSVILLLPSLAIATMTGIDVTVSILIMGGFTIVYTALGGMKAVVWTDVVQLIVKMGGIFFALGFIVYSLDGGVAELLTTAAAENKMKLFDFRLDLTTATVWGFLFLVLFDVVLTFPKDQVLMQRVLSTKSEKDAGRSIWTFAAVMIPGGFLFYLVGTALFVFYKRFPERMNPLLALDATFPFFIAAELPNGIRGLIIAGILAAAMATLSSIMNSVATLASVDFYEKRVKNPNPQKSVRFAEIMTALTGVAGIAVALVLSRYDIQSLFDASLELAGVLGGGFAGTYTLGMFTRRANWQGVAIGVAVSIVATTTAWHFQWVHPFFYLAISIFICITVGYLASWFFPTPEASALRGLTIYADTTTSSEAEDAPPRAAA